VRSDGQDTREPGSGRWNSTAPRNRRGKEDCDGCEALVGRGECSGVGWPIEPRITRRRHGCGRFRSSDDGPIWRPRVAVTLVCRRTGGTGG
jgi:hypothetical protein